jgi:DNA-binding NarL/FixJ family response regulator
VRSGTCAAFDLAADKFRLTPREREILRSLARGEPWKGVAQALGISVETVRFHVANIHRKAGAANSFCAFCKIVGFAV